MAGIRSKELNKKIYIPKDEDALSNYVKRHLEEDLEQRGIVVNREVQIRLAERTDIHVDAVTRESTANAYGKSTVIIETKGCWNPELESAMETQLVDRYLKNNPSQYGLYLIGWFNCDLWDDRDYRKADAPSIAIQEAQQQYNQQANDLSVRGVKVKALVVNTSLPG